MFKLKSGDTESLPHLVVFRIKRGNPHLVFHTASVAGECSLQSSHRAEGHENGFSYGGMGPRCGL